MEKKPFSRLEWHSIITSYSALVLSAIAILLTTINMLHIYKRENRETLRILDLEDDGYYHFDLDSNKLSRNLRIMVSNESAFSVGIVKIDVKRNGSLRSFEHTELSFLPLNLDTNHTEILYIPWEITLSDETTENVRNALYNSEYTERNDETNELLIQSYRNMPFSVTVHTARDNSVSSSSLHTGLTMDMNREGEEAIKFATRERAFGGGRTRGHGASL